MAHDCPLRQHKEGNKELCDDCRRLREYAPDFHMLEFYSDSRSDTPLAQVSDKAFLVKGDELLPW